MPRKKDKQLQVGCIDVPILCLETRFCLVSLNMRQPVLWALFIRGTKEKPPFGGFRKKEEKQIKHDIAELCGLKQKDAPMYHAKTQPLSVD